MTTIDVDALSKQKKPSDSDYYIASDRWACIDRNGEIYTQTNSELDKCIPIKDPTNKLRQKINELNSALAGRLAQRFDCHLQFDGKDFTPIPQLIRNEKQIQAIAQKDPLVAKHLESYKLTKLGL
jgi:hypothetical protein